MTTKDDPCRYATVMRRLRDQDSQRFSMYIHGQTMNFTFTTNYPSLYVVPVSECYLVDLIPPNIHNLVFIKTTTVNQFQNECSETKVPINSNVMFLTGDWQDNVQIWDVYRPKPEDNMK